MVRDVVLFVTIAEIAGIFVGFAALIAVTRRSEIDASQLGQIRALVTIGLLVVVAALIPVSLGAYDVADRTLWRVASLVYLVLNWTVIYRADAYETFDGRALLDDGDPDSGSAAPGRVRRES